MEKQKAQKPAKQTQTQTNKQAPKPIDALGTTGVSMAEFLEERLAEEAKANAEKHARQQANMLASIRRANQRDKLHMKRIKKLERGPRKYTPAASTIRNSSVG